MSGIVIGGVLVCLLVIAVFGIVVGWGKEKGDASDTASMADEFTIIEDAE